MFSLSKEESLCLRGVEGGEIIEEEEEEREVEVVEEEEFKGLELKGFEIGLFESEGVGNLEEGEGVGEGKTDDEGPLLVETGEGGTVCWEDRIKLMGKGESTLVESDS